MAHRLAPAAEAGLDDIWYYIAKESQSFEIADHVVDSITDSFFFSRTIPISAAAATKTCGPACAAFPVGEYVIIYRVEDDGVLILYVVRGSRDIEALFRP